MRVSVFPHRDRSSNKRPSANQSFCGLERRVMRGTYLGFSLRMFSLAVVFLAMPIAAQWMNYPTAGIPRTKDGKPNLSAPAPRTSDGKPDLSGIWESEKRNLADGFGGSGPRTVQFTDIGAGLKGGLPYQPWAADL